MLGKRKEAGPPHNMVLTFIGASLLWVGWFGFNAGSAVTAGMQAGMAMTVTQIATAVAGFTWMLVEWAARGKPTVVGICSGAVAGLVAITPASGFVGPIGSMVIGIAAGVFCYWGVTGLKRMHGVDDALDCFGVHAVGGIVGALLTGVFAIAEYGGTVVHINAGVAGLMCAICLGKRKDVGPGHNMVLTFIGASLLWVGWFGFNAGSAVTAGMQAGMAMTVTQIATAVAAFTWMLVEWMARGKPTVIGICSGAVAGLVAITPASGFVGPAGSMAIGVAAGVFCYWGATGLKRMLGKDDALDVFGVHGVGGIVGALLTGVFAIEQYGGTAGLIEGNAAQMINQVQGILVVIIYDAIVSLIILKIIDAIIGLRVTDEVEREGLDLALHGETVQ